MSCRLVALAMGLATLVGPQLAHGALAGMQRVASGLNQPIFATHAPNDPTRLFIAQRGGTIRILNLTTGVMEATNFLSISGVDAEGEGGMLGMAFHPDYANNGKFYTYSTHDNGGIDVGGAASPFSTQIREYTVSTNPNVANAAISKTLMNFGRPQNNHVGGWIGFSPDSSQGFNLYIASGDGGGGNDNATGHTAGVGNAQDTTNNWFGKILRIDVDGDDFPSDATRNYAIPDSNPFTAEKPNSAPDDEIWAYGLRNPFRNSFDRATGNLWIGDVGQGAREEIDFQASGVGGLNFGWRLREGTIATPSGGVGGPAPVGAVNPVYDYLRTGDFGGSVVTGGYVYRGPDPTLQGKYFFFDSNNSAVTSDDNYWLFEPANPYGTVDNIDAELTPNTGTAQFPASFGEDANGNLYVLAIGSGEVYRINTNAFRTGDFDGDADVDGDDLTRWKTGFGTASGATRTSGDANGDGAVDGDDFLAWQQNVGWSALDVIPANAAVPEPQGAALLIVASISLLLVRRTETIG